MTDRTVTPADVARARRVLNDMASWQTIVGEAAELHHDLRTAAWPDIADWYASIPAYLPPREAERWLRSQRVQASWTTTGHVGLLSDEDQLRIAIESARRREAAGLVDDDVEDYVEHGTHLVAKTGGGYNVGSDRAVGERLPRTTRTRLDELIRANRPPREIALACGVSDRTVYRYKSRLTHPTQALTA